MKMKIVALIHEKRPEKMVREIPRWQLYIRVGMTDSDCSTMVGITRIVLS